MSLVESDQKQSEILSKTVFNTESNSDIALLCVKLDVVAAVEMVYCVTALQYTSLKYNTAFALLYVQGQYMAGTDDWFVVA